MDKLHKAYSSKAIYTHHYDAYMSCKYLISLWIPFAN